MLTRPEDAERLEREENTRNYRSNTTWETMPEALNAIVTTYRFKNADEEREYNTKYYTSSSSWEEQSNDVKIIMAMYLLKKEFSFLKEEKRMPQSSIQNDVQTEEKMTTPLLRNTREIPLVLIWKGRYIVGEETLTQPNCMDISFPLPSLRDPYQAAMTPCEEAYCGNAYEQGCIAEFTIDEDTECTPVRCLKALVCCLPISIVACPVVSIASACGFFSSKVDNCLSVRDHNKKIGREIDRVMSSVLPERPRQ